MANLTTVGITSGVPSSGTGTVSTIDNLIAVGSPINNGSSSVQVAITGASSAPTSSMSALVVGLSPNSVNANGQATMANSAPVVIASNQTSLPITLTSSAGVNTANVVAGSSAVTSTMPALVVALSSLGSAAAVVPPLTLDVSVTPTVSTAQYTAGNVIGGPMVFASVLASNSFNGVLESITAKFKGTAVTGTISVALFKSSALAGTYTDHGAPTFAAADAALLLGTYQLTTPLSVLGTMTSYNLDGIGKALVASSASLTAVAIVASSITPSSNADFTLELSVLPG